MAHIDAGKTTTTETGAVLYRHHLQDRRGARRNRGDGLDGPGTGAGHHHHLRRHDVHVARQPNQYHRHPGACGLHGGSRTIAARAGRRRGRVRCGGRRGAAIRDGLASGRQVPGAAHLFREQDGPRGGRFRAYADADSREAPGEPGGGPASARGGRRFRRRDRSGRHEGGSISGRIARRRIGARGDSGRRLDEATAAREALIEKVCEVDDRLLEKYLHGEPIAAEEIVPILRRRTIESVRNEDAPLVPVLCGSAFRNKGVQPLIDAVVDYLPSPADIPAVTGTAPDGDTVLERPARDEAPFSALAFKIMTDPYVGQLAFIRVYSGVMASGATIYNPRLGRRERIGRLLKMHANKREDIQQVYSGDIAAAVGLKTVGTGDTICDRAHPVLLETMEFPTPVITLAIEPKTKADQEKLGQGLAKLTTEDPTFQVRTDDETGQVVVSGMGELHLEIIVDRLRREFGVAATVGRPQVAYRETLTRPALAEGRYVKQTGGRGQYGHVKLRVVPRPAGDGFVFENRIFGGAIPKEFIASVEAGVREAVTTGILAGYPIEDVVVTLLDGSSHDVDSSEMAFKIAGSMAFRNAARQAVPVLLEPIMKVEVVVPEVYMGDIIADINARRGRVKSMEAHGGTQIINARVPLSEMFGYATELRSRTQGRATYTMHFDRYDQVPPAVSEEIVARIQGR
ncbi:Elongation factor G 2 [Geodia barretti]|uniref:Elongation factor G 2 n=1 Tax=Geodia barretti TaxID=519541 RepID=A0AA35RQ43_GEOBA|nr:Elongation factor G 2 [Geodia barretti]